LSTAGTLALDDIVYDVVHPYLWENQSLDGGVYDGVTLTPADKVDTYMTDIDAVIGTLGAANMWVGETYAAYRGSDAFEDRDASRQLQVWFLTDLLNKLFTRDVPWTVGWVTATYEEKREWNYEAMTDADYFDYVVPDVQEGFLATGINYLSDGNRGADHTTTKLGADFALFKSYGITFVDARLVWTSIEPSSGSYSDTVIANYARLLDYAENIGLRVGLTFWTQPPYESRNFALPSWVSDWDDLWTDAGTRTSWLDMVEYVLDELGDKPALYYVNICNEPYSSSGQRSQQETWMSLTADKIIANVPANVLVGSRFIAGWNPYESYFANSLMDKLDILGLTVYNDPGNDGYNTASRATWATIESSIDAAKAAGKQAWIIEFGKNTNEELQRVHYEGCLQDRFLPYEADAAFAWAWTHSGGSIGNWNICSGQGNPKSAFYELAKAAGPYTPPEPPEPPPPAEYTLTITKTDGGTTSPSITHTYTAGTVVGVGAYPEENYAFVRWLLNGSLHDTDIVTNVTMTQNYTLHAVFEAVPQTGEYKLIVLGSVGGSTSPVAGNYTYEDGTIVPVYATVLDGYTMEKWQVDGVDYAHCEGFLLGGQ
jgi:hypothetical protein